MSQQVPAWKNLKGVKRIQAEFRHLTREVAAGKLNFIRDLTLVDDTLSSWRFKLHNFDEDIPGGKDLNADLLRLKQMYGQDHLLMEVQFPKDYPHEPLFIRVVSPRCRMYTGHVTAGGSICLEALTNSGPAGAWQPDMCVESLLNVVIINMIDCPSAYVQTATGPGGRSGPLRIDFSCGNPTYGYSQHEAKAAFHRTLENHQRDAQLDPNDIGELSNQGLSYEDAAAALLLSEGDVEEALVRAATCTELGGAAKAWQEMRHLDKPSQDGRKGSSSSSSQQQAAAAALAEEVERVLSSFELGGNQRSKVVRLQRLQHARLWRRYCVFKHELAELRGQEGFDFRLVSYTSAYGNGTYFADHSLTAAAYCTRPLATGRGAGGVGAGMMAGAPFPWPVPTGPAPAGLLMGMPGPLMAGAGGMAGAFGGPLWASAPAPVLPPAAGIKTRSKRGAGSSSRPKQKGTSNDLSLPAGCYKLLLARVALGRQGTGVSGMRKPPDGCDSVNSGAVPSPAVGPSSAMGMMMPGVMGQVATNMSTVRKSYYCHVIFDNHQAYPEEYGPVVGLLLGGERVVLVADPAAARQVLIDDASDVFVKAGTAFFPGSSLTGNGLLVSDGETWRRQRRMTNPAFRKAAVDRVELYAAFVALAGSGGVAAAATAVAARGATAMVVPEWVPTPDNVAFKEAVQQLDDLVDVLLAGRYSLPGGTTVLVSPYLLHREPRFAMTEAVIILAMLLQRYELKPVTPAAGFPRAKPMLTLRPEAVPLRICIRK
eukprot:gene8971-9146_t